jgi:hypothetical protein
MKRVLPFLLLNIAISAVTMIIVLVIWQSFHKVPETQVHEGSSLPSTAQPALRSQGSYAGDSIEILNVIGPGDLKFEAITLKNSGKSAVDLTGWSIRGSQGKRFTFPTFTVFPNGAFQVFSRSGVNTSLELYWGSTEALWQSGGSVTLYDPADQKRQQFVIP